MIVQSELVFVPRDFIWITKEFVHKPYFLPLIALKVNIIMLLKDVFPAQLDAQLVKMLTYAQNAASLDLFQKVMFVMLNVVMAIFSLEKSATIRIKFQEMAARVLVKLRLITNAVVFLLFVQKEQFVEMELFLKQKNVMTKIQRMAMDAAKAVRSRQGILVLVLHLAVKKGKAIMGCS